MADWIEGPEGLDADVLARDLQKAGVLIESGYPFSAMKTAHAGISGWPIHPFRPGTFRKGWRGRPLRSELSCRIGRDPKSHVGDNRFGRRPY